MILELIVDWEKFFRREQRQEKPPKPGDFVYYLEYKELDANCAKRKKNSTKVGRFWPIEERHILSDQEIKDPQESFVVTERSRRTGKPRTYARGSLEAATDHYKALKKVIKKY